jgi:hypothetical protein
VLHQRRFGRLDFPLVVLAAHAGLLPASGLPVSASASAVAGSLGGDAGAVA